MVRSIVKARFTVSVRTRVRVRSIGRLRFRDKSGPKAMVMLS
jgi:hypothetical protein